MAEERRIRQTREPRPRQGDEGHPRQGDDGPTVVDSARATAPVSSGRAGVREWASAAWQSKIVTTLLLLIVVVPLVSGTPLLENTGKLVAFKVLGTLLLVLVLGQMNFAGGWPRLRVALSAGPHTPLALFVLLSAASFACVPPAFRAFAASELARVGFAALIYVALVAHLRSKMQLQVLMDGLLGVGAAVSLIGLAQLGSEGTGLGVVGSTFGSHELLGSFLMLLLPIALALGVIDRGEPRRQLFAQVVALLLAAGLLMARARAAWVGEVVALLVLVGLTRWCAPKQARVRVRKHQVIGPLVILVGAVLLVVTLSQMSTILGQRAGTLAKVVEDESFQTRMGMWRGTVAMIEARPLLGWGLGMFPLREQEWTYMGDPAAAVLTRGFSHNNIAHNFYLQTAAELGLTGLLLWLATLGAFAVVAVRALPGRETGLRKSVLLGGVAAMAGQAVDALGSPAYNFASVDLYVWVVLGLGMFAAGTGNRAFPRGGGVEGEALRRPEGRDRREAGPQRRREPESETPESETPESETNVLKSQGF